MKSFSIHQKPTNKKKKKKKNSLKNYWEENEKLVLSFFCSIFLFFLSLFKQHMEYNEWYWQRVREINWKRISRKNKAAHRQIIIIIKNTPRGRNENWVSSEYTEKEKEWTKKKKNQRFYILLEFAVPMRSWTK